MEMMNDELMCAPRDYEREIVQYQKEIYCLREQVSELERRIEELKECIVKMNIARYCRNGN